MGTVRPTPEGEGERCERHRIKIRGWILIGVVEQISLGIRWSIAAEECGLMVVDSLLPRPQLQWLKGEVWCW